jgi:inosose dehydratase
MTFSAKVKTGTLVKLGAFEEFFIMNRREFLVASSAFAAVTQIFAADAEGAARYRIGYTSNTRGGWEKDPFVGFREAHEVGFNWIEHFASSLDAFYPDKAPELKRRLDEIGVGVCAITGGRRGGNTHFEDPASRQDVIENHLGVIRFSKKFGANHQKTNMGARRPTGTTEEDLKNMAETLQQLGKRAYEEEGIRFGVHAHLGSQLQNEHEISYIMANTDPKYVGFVLDTGHITMAGMDPLALARKLGKRVVEFHLKDTKPEDHGGTKHVPGPEVDMMKDPYFYPLGSGGVDFIGLKAYLDSIDWRGFLVVELDTSPWRPPKESARITANYIRNRMKIAL